jgi:hypothetical protein
VGVRHQLGEFWLKLEATGYKVEVEDWPSEQAKGLDDLLASGGKPDVVRDGSEPT